MPGFNMLKVGAVSTLAFVLAPFQLPASVKQVCQVLPKVFGQFPASGVPALLSLPIRSLKALSPRIGPIRSCSSIGQEVLKSSQLAPLHAMLSTAQGAPFPAKISTFAPAKSLPPLPQFEQEPHTHPAAVPGLASVTKQLLRRMKIGDSDTTPAFNAHAQLKQLLANAMLIGSKASLRSTGNCGGGWQGSSGGAHSEAWLPWLLAAVAAVLSSQLAAGPDEQCVAGTGGHTPCCTSHRRAAVFRVPRQTERVEFVRLPTPRALTERCEAEVSFQLLVQVASGRTIAVDVKSLELVGALKVKIEEKDGVPRDEQRLIFGGKELCDACTLASCDIDKEASVHLQLGMRGGIGTGQREVLVGLGAGYAGASVTVEEVRADGYAGPPIFAAPPGFTPPSASAEGGYAIPHPAPGDPPHVPGAGFVVQGPPPIYAPEPATAAPVPMTAPTPAAAPPTLAADTAKVELCIIEGVDNDKVTLTHKSRDFHAAAMEQTDGAANARSQSPNPSNDREGAEIRSVQLEHSTPDLRCFSLSGDGTLAAVGDSTSNSVSIFNTRTAQSIFKFKNHHLCTLSSDGRILAICSSVETTVRDLKTCKTIAQIKQPRSTASMAFSKAGNLLALADEGGQVAIYAVQSCSEVSLVRQVSCDSPIMSLCVCSGCHELVVALNDSIQIFDIYNGERLALLPEPGVTCVSLSEDGSAVAFGRPDHSFVARGAIGDHVILHEDLGSRVESVAFSADNKYIGACTKDGTAVVYPVACHSAHNISPEAKMKLHLNEQLTALALSSNGQLASVCGSSTLTCHDASGGKKTVDRDLRSALLAAGDNFTSVEPGQVFAAVKRAGGKSEHVAQDTSQNKTFSFKPPKEDATSSWMISDETALFAYVQKADLNTVHVVDVTTQQVVCTSQHQSECSLIWLANPQQPLLAVWDERTLEVRDVFTAALLWKLPDQDEVTEVFKTASSTRIVLGGKDLGFYDILDILSGEKLARFTIDAETVEDFSLSFDGSLLITHNLGDREDPGHSIAIKNTLSKDTLFESAKLPDIREVLAVTAKYYAYGCSLGRFTVVDLEDPSRKFYFQDSGLTSLEFCKNGYSLESHSTTGHVCVRDLESAATWNWKYAPEKFIMPLPTPISPEARGLKLHGTCIVESTGKARIEKFQLSSDGSRHGAWTQRKLNGKQAQVITIRETQSGDVVFSTNPNPQVEGVALSANLKYISMATESKATVWNTETGSEVYAAASTSRISGLDVSNTGRIIICSQDCQVRECGSDEDGATTTITTPKLDDNGDPFQGDFFPFDPAFSRDGTKCSFVYSDHNNMRLCVKNVREDFDAEEVVKLPLGGGYSAFHAVSSTASLVALVSSKEKSAVTIIETKTKLTIAVFKGESELNSITISPDEEWLLSGRNDGKLIVTHILSGCILYRLDVHDFVFDVFCTDSNMVGCVRHPGKVHIFDLGSSNLVLEEAQGDTDILDSDDPSEELDRKEGSQVFLLPGHSTYAVCSTKLEPVKVFDLVSREQLYTIQRDTADSIVFSDDGSRLLLIAEEWVQVRDLSSGETLFTSAPSAFGSDNQTQTSELQATMSGDGNFLAVYTSTPREGDDFFDRQLCCIDVESCSVFFTVDDIDSEAEEIFTCLRFNQDGSQFAYVVESKVTILTREENIFAVEQAFSFSHADWVNAIAFSRGGELIATTGFDNVLRIHNLQTHHLHESIVQESGNRVCRMAFSEGDQNLIVLSSTSVVYVWSVLDGSSIVRLNLMPLTGSPELSTDCSFIGWMNKEQEQPLIFSLPKLYRLGLDTRTAKAALEGTSSQIFDTSLATTFAAVLALSSLTKQPGLQVATEGGLEGSGSQHSQQNQLTAQLPHNQGRSMPVTVHASLEIADVDAAVVGSSATNPESGSVTGNSESESSRPLSKSLVAELIRRNNVADLDILLQQFPAASVIAVDGEHPIPVAVAAQNRKAVELLLMAIARLPKQPGWNHELHRRLSVFAQSIPAIVNAGMEDILDRFFRCLHTEGTVTVPVDGYSGAMVPKDFEEAYKPSRHCRVNREIPDRDVWSGAFQVGTLQNESGSLRMAVPHVLLLPNIASLTVLRALQGDSMKTVLDNPTMRIAVKVVWAEARKGFLWDTAAFFTLALLYTVFVSLTVRPDYNSGFRDSYWIPGLVCGALSQILNLKFALQEIREAREVGWDYLKSPWNVITASTNCLVISSFCAISSKRLEEQHARPLSAVTVLVVWCNTLFFLRGFDAYSYLIQMLLAIIVDIVPFVVVLGIVMVGFTCAFFLLLGDLNSNWVTWPQALGNILRASILGDFDMEDFEHSDSSAVDRLGTALFSLMAFLINLVALNALIAIMGSTHERVTEGKVLERQVSHTSLSVEFMQLMSSEGLADMEDRFHWIHVLSPSSDGKTHDIAGEAWDGRDDSGWSGQVDALKREVRTTVAFEMQRISRDLQSIQTVLQGLGKTKIAKEPKRHGR